MKISRYIKLACIVVVMLPCIAHAKAIPYYASIISDDANIRTGPNVRYPIQWIYKRKNWPVQVTATFERWRKISDVNGEIGWIHESLLSKRRFATIKSNGMQEAYRLPLLTSAKIFIAENNTVVEIKECKNLWCKVANNGYSGWIQQEFLWGIDKGELID